MGNYENIYLILIYFWTYLYTAQSCSYDKYRSVKGLLKCDHLNRGRLTGPYASYAWVSASSRPGPFLHT